MWHAAKCYVTKQSVAAAAACNISVLQRKMEFEMQTWTFNSWKYAHYFKLIRSKDQKKKYIVSRRYSDYFHHQILLKHLQRQHDTTKLVEIDPSRGESSVAMDDGCCPTLANSKNWIFLLQQASCSFHLPVTYMDAKAVKNNCWIEAWAAVNSDYTYIYTEVHSLAVSELWGEMTQLLTFRV